ncbi:MAG: hypothetical protein H7X95_13380, partial [Deltaproteobacteria bacterium]|nr:hypothetical protein [Deltaproteobacteria bacterium]
PPTTPSQAGAVAEKAKVDAAGVSATDAGLTDAGDPAPPAATGDWIETVLYKFKAGDAVACQPRADAGTAGGSGTADAGAVADGGGGQRQVSGKKTDWIAFFIEIQARKNESFVSPRDVTLRRGGIILDPRFHQPPTFPRCSPLMQQKLLRAGELLRGHVLFEIPPSFRAAPGPTTLTYRPTRWGGAPRAQLQIPDCLEACPQGAGTPLIDSQPTKSARSRKQTLPRQ